MRQRHAASRLVMLATIAALAASMVAPTASSARSGAGASADKSAPAAHADGVRSSRYVDVSRLPKSTGKASPYSGTLARPTSEFRSAAPSSVTAAVAPTFATTNTDPAIGEATSFAGLAFAPASPTAGEPPDPWVAAGPEHVAQVVNTAFRFTNRSGGAPIVVDMFDFFLLNTFYSPGQVAFFDPHIVYDSLHQRWVAIEASFDCDTQFADAGTGFIDYAVSLGPDPTGAWFVRSIGFQDALPDYPGIGTSTDKIVFSSNVFGIVSTGTGMGCAPDDGSFLGTEMDVVAWSEAVTSANITEKFLFSPVNFPNSFFSWRPSLQVPAISPTVFVVSQMNTGAMAYARITGSAAGSSQPSIAITDLTTVITGFSNPPAPKQPDGSTIVDAVDGRPTDAIWKDNRLAVVSTATCDPAGGIAEQRDCVRVSELNTTNTTPTVVQTFLVGEEAADLYMGGIGYALNNDLHVVWTRSSEAPGQYPSSYAAYQSAAAANRSLSARALISAGTGNYPGDRWGDYVGVAQDPQVPNAVWQANEFSTGANFWATEVSQLQTGGTSYVPITPVRVVDTRPAFSIGLSGVFAANVPRTFKVAGNPSFPTIPANAVAVTGNVTVTGQTSAGYLVVTPTPVVNPPSSTINFPLVDTRANNFTTPLSAGKLAAVYKAPAGRSTHVIVDITGYFLAGSDDATYATLPPVRVLDTRPAFSIGLTGTFKTNTPRTLSIAGANGVPADATAITANVTVVNQTKSGYLAITPAFDPNPPTSVLNFPLGDIRANGASLPLNNQGDLSIVYKATSAGTTNVILDVTGYYRDDPSGLQFFPLTPGRVLDSRPGVSLSGLTGTFKSSTPRQLPVAGHWGVPASAKAISGNLTVVNQTAAGYVAATLVSDPNPTTSVLNFPLNDIRANGVTLPLNGTGKEFFVYKGGAGKTTNLILDVSGYFN